MGLFLARLFNQHLMGVCQEGGTQHQVATTSRLLLRGVFLVQRVQLCHGFAVSSFSKERVENGSSETGFERL